jgi:hypothetical protein
VGAGGGEVDQAGDKGDGQDAVAEGACDVHEITWQLTVHSS